MVSFDNPAGGLQIVSISVEQDALTVPNKTLF